MINMLSHKNYQLNYKGTLISLSEPKIMGVINLTPDSFYEQTRHKNVNKVIDTVGKMIEDGVDIVDFGGYSTRPGADDISVQEELDRLLPVVSQVMQDFPNLFISVDTFRYQVAQEVLQSGVGIINDIMGVVADEKMLDVVLNHQCIYIAMHIQGTPQTMQVNPNYKNVTIEVTQDLSKIKYDLQSKGFNNLVIDPGFGFGKTIEHNYELMQNLNHLQVLNLPILVGISRKSMIYKLLKTTPQQALNGTTALNIVALLKGANILRVHDVKEAVEVKNIYLELAKF
jgi:dihydropteroate synthase